MKNIILKKPEVRRYLQELKDWSLTKERHLARNFKFRDFNEALKFVNEIALIAQKENHHPDILIYNYNNVRIEFYTHSVNGLTEKDFITVNKINQMNGVRRLKNVNVE